MSPLLDFSSPDGCSRPGFGRHRPWVRSLGTGGMIHREFSGW